MVEKKRERELERSVFELILYLPERLAVTEMRSEENSLLLAKRIYRLVRNEMRGSDAASA